MDYVECSFSDIKKDTMSKSRSDLVSKKLGELLLQGFRMLNATCPKCDCILMQRKNEPVYCVSCQDEELNEPEPIKLESNENNYTNSVALDEAPPQMISSKTKLNGNGTRSVSSVQSQGANVNAVEALRHKINWATQELASSLNVKYNIELCEMIKAASEAIVSLKKTETDF